MLPEDVDEPVLALGLRPRDGARALLAAELRDGGEREANTVDQQELLEVARHSLRQEPHFKHNERL